MTNGYRDSREREIDERIINIERVATVVKGGRRFSFRVTMVAGDQKGRVGMGMGKANSVPDAIHKASDRAKDDLHPVAVYNTTIPHKVMGKVGGAKVMLKPASEGTGVIAAGSVRAVVEVSGITNILTKSLGSDNAMNIAAATIQGLEQLKDPHEEAAIRGVDVEKVTPFWDR
ncbi:MAG: 30S ribosomal protein S5 [Anaerolineales bacterium]|nr:30S ribosomal protein S5 [Anaerolineales bacterium]MBS3752284.1 30S ribosomal protein S5 [Anaerolineales bacterium]